MNSESKKKEIQFRDVKQKRRVTIDEIQAEHLSYVTIAFAYCAYAIMFFFGTLCDFLDKIQYKLGMKKNPLWAPKGINELPSLKMTIFKVMLLYLKKSSTFG